MDRVILHIDLNNFFASVETIGHLEYLNVPIAVCGSEELRHGIVLAKNNLAKALGVCTGEAIWQAKTKCRNLVIVKPHYDKYAYYSKVVREIYYNYTDRIESFGLDECWLDVTGSQKLFGSGEEIANLIREEVKAKTTLTVSVGVSFTKVFAKLGSDMKKPDATTVLSRENYRTKVWNLPVEEMLYIGKQTCKKLHLLNVFTIGQLAHTDDRLLANHFGIVGQKMKRDALGIEDGEVLKFDECVPLKSVGNGTTTKDDIKNNEEVRTVIYYLSETIASRLRQYGLCCMGVSINVRDNRLESFSRQKALNIPLNSSDDIAKVAYQCFLDNYDFNSRPPVRTLTIGTYNLVSENYQYQLSLFDNSTVDTKKDKLGKSLDKIRERFGFESVTKAAFIDNSLVGVSHNPNDGTLPFQKGNAEIRSENIKKSD